MEPGIYILAEGISGLIEPLDADGLAAVHPAWAEDVRRLGPWSEMTIPFKGRPGGGLAALRSGSGSAVSATLICGRCSSTMDGVRYLVDAAGLEPWDCLLAVEQLQGRGQTQRSWISPPGNLYVSWYWPDPGGVRGASEGWRAMASLMAGELTASVLESFGADIRIKWPNDLLANDRKICGILVENRAGMLIVGIGLNLASAPGKNDLTDAFAIPAASLRDAGLEITPLEFWSRLAQAGRSRFYHLVEAMPPDAFMELVHRRLAWKGSRVTVRKSEQDAYNAEIRGLSADGGLIVKTNEKTRVIYTGSILPEDNISFRSRG
ncbi:MAG: biotin--[acetyl-CoA-carboxylase] ligase [Thermodesulfobacteriota bacterium]